MSIRMRLFGSLSESPSLSTTDCSDTELFAVLTPSTKGDNSPDSGVWSSAECSAKKQSSYPYPHTVTPESRRSLFSGQHLTQHQTIEETPRSRRNLIAVKRLVEFEEVDVESPSTKRLRRSFKQCHIRSDGPGRDWLDNFIENGEEVTAAVSAQVPGNKSRCIPSVGITCPDQITDLSSISHEERIVQAVETLTSECCVADGSRDYCLPIIPSKHLHLKCISADTMYGAIRGDYSDRIDDVTIVDCRYPYEYNGGHIKKALNLFTKDDIRSLLREPATSDKRRVVVFHCEFSSERGPKMSCFLRSEDRDLNKDRYPRLHFPEVYLLDGGYKAFYSKYPNVCEPRNYVPMLHQDHTNELRHFRHLRVKSKSWTAGERQAAERRDRAKMPRARKSMEFV